MAFDEEKVVVCDIFSTRDVVIESCNIDEEMGTVIIKGHMLNDKYGVYALRIVNIEKLNNSLLIASPQSIISPEMKNRPFTVSFNNATRVIQDPLPKIVEVYIRIKPENIRYNAPFNDRIHFEHLDLGCRIPFISFPLEQQIREENREEQEEEDKLREEEKSKQIEKNRERDEKLRRQRIDGEA